MRWPLKEASFVTGTFSEDSHQVEEPREYKSEIKQS